MLGKMGFKGLVDERYKPGEHGEQERIDDGGC